MDFGTPVDIGRVVYVPRGDGNFICIGDKYELLYWQDGQWNSLGKQTADNIKLEYENVPMDGLYWLRNHTKGTEERIFTYEGRGEQIWW